MNAANVPITRLRRAATFSLGTEPVFPIAGFVGVAVLVLATSVPGPPRLTLPLGLTGMGVVVLAWLGLGQRRAEFTVRQLYWTAVVWCLPLLVARPLFSGDVRSYLAQGVIAADGLDPYRLSPLAALGAGSPVTQQVSLYWQQTPAPYGPVAVAISRTIAGLVGENLVATVLLNRFVEIAGVVLIAWALPRLARRAGVPAVTALWLGLLNPLVLWHVVAGVHYEGLMLGLVLAGMEVALGGVARPGRVTAGVVLLSVAANIKIVAAVALLCLGLELARRRGHTVGDALVLLLGLFMGFTVVSVVIAEASGLGFGWVGTVKVTAQVHSWLAPTNQLGFLIGAFGGPARTSTAITASIRIDAVLGAIAVTWLSSRAFRDGRHPLTTLGQVFAVILVTGPVVQAWYPLWAILPLSASVRTHRVRRVIVAVSALFAVLIPPSSGGISLLIESYLAAAALLILAWVAIRAIGLMDREPAYAAESDQRRVESG